MRQETKNKLATAMLALENDPEEINPMAGLATYLSETSSLAEREELIAQLEDKI